MKTAVYITKNKIWAGESVFEWDGVSLDDVLGKIKKELKIDEIRIVLGNDVSFVTAINMGEMFVSRENVLKMVKSWMPFEIDNDCFDWKIVTLSSKEEWVQIVALEKELLMSLSSAVLKHGLKVELITAIGIVLGEKTKEREVPVIIRWNEKEQLSVVAVNGLIDLVVSEIPEEDLMVYAKGKWGLAVNPETVVISGEELNLSEAVFAIKTKGDDGLVLNLPILKQIITSEKSENESEDKFVPEKIEESKPKSKLWIYLLILVIVSGIGAFVMYNAGLFEFLVPKKPVEVAVPSISPTPEITIEPSPVDLTSFSIQVLNGSGVTGEAASIKTLLIDQGFENIDIGNAEATNEGVIRSKIEIPKVVLDIAENITNDYMMGEPDVLTAESEYDLIIVVGSAKKL